MRNKLKVVLTTTKLKALQGLYIWLVRIWESETEHEELLLEHAIIMRDLIDEKLRYDQDTYTIKLNSADALAFYQTWKTTDTTHDLLGNVTVLELIGKIDKKAKHPKHE